MITWREDLLVGDEAKRSGRKIISGIKKNKFQPGIYIITLAANGTDVFDIIPTCMLDPDLYKKKDLEILAVAKGKTEARELCEKLIMDAYSETGNFDIRGFYS